MKGHVITVALTALTLLGLALPVSAQTIPDVRNTAAYSSDANYMSLPGYMRWQYFEDNNSWVSFGRAIAMVRNEGVVVASSATMTSRTHSVSRMHRTHTTRMMHRTHGMRTMHRNMRTMQRTHGMRHTHRTYHNNMNR